MEPPLNQAVSSYSDHDNGSLKLLHLHECFYKVSTTWLATPWRCICHKYLFRGSDLHTTSSDLNERGQHPPLPGGGYLATDLHQGAPNPRIEAPIRQEHPITWQNEPRTPYQPQVKVPPILTTQSSGVGRGALKELIKKRSEELEYQMATVGQGQGLSSKTQGVGATPKKHVAFEEAPDQEQQVRGRSQSCL